ncbi:hypothetical protein Acr_25g0002030 [Actinidia rufa]|uniref:Uncharacterized protein n=1 Tax=Actinidia rufa TaxID=165716 RepID=A0A7J0GZ51_9ERIC|nr:hypothetical protein Acr_25g0002030 [Actinidia rufa]
METRGPSEKSKSKGNEGVGYDASRFTENTGTRFVQNFTSRGWINLTKFKAKSALTLCQEFMANIKYNPETEKGKEKLCSWVCGKKLKVTPDIFTEIFEIPREDNLEFDFSDVGMPDLAVGFTRIAFGGKRMRWARLLWAIGTGKTIDLPRMMLLSLCTAHTASDKSGYVPFTGFLTELFKRSGVHIPLNITKIEPEGAIDRSSLSRSERLRKKRKLEVTAHEEPPIDMAELNEAIMNLEREMGAQMSEFKAEVNACMTSLEKKSRRHTTMLQEIKGMMIQMEAEYDDEEEEEED